MKVISYHDMRNGKDQKMKDIRMECDMDRTEKNGMFDGNVERYKTVCKSEKKNEWLRRLSVIVLETCLVPIF